MRIFKFLLLLMLLGMAGLVNAQKLRFNEAGEFRIIQFTDMHIDYIGVSHNVALAFGRCSGGENAYGDLPDGGRVIVLKEGKRAFDTWIHEKGGNIVYKCSYPESFALQKK